MDLYLSLYTGGTLICLSKSLQSDMKLLYKCLGESCGSKWISTPSFADVCLSDPCFSEELLPELKDFFFCGEVLTNRTVDRLLDRFPNTCITNTYGPTESTCAVTSLSISKEINRQYTPLPVGVPKPGTRIEIRNKDNHAICGEGQPGEIIIIGDSVSIGYWKKEDLNKKKFGSLVLDQKNTRYYRTGDEGYMINNMLFYCGRIDLQVKMHGYRIEIEDIENNLIKIPEIAQAVVVPKYRDGKVVRLVAGVVLNPPFEDDRQAVSYIKNQLKKMLPEYMIPSKIRLFTSLPLTNNGKLDRKAAGDLL